MLTGQTDLPSNQPTSLKVKNLHNFVIFQLNWLKLVWSLEMEELNICTLYILSNQPTIQPAYQPKSEQGRIHGNPVADGWAGAVMRKPLAIQKCDGRTDGPTDGRTDGPTRQGVESRVRD